VEKVIGGKWAARFADNSAFTSGLAEQHAADVRLAIAVNTVSDDRERFFADGDIWLISHGWLAS
jgi:hypothetical protein